MEDNLQKKMEDDLKKKGGKRKDEQNKKMENDLKQKKWKTTSKKIKNGRRPKKKDF
jgi:hypothetical protein